MDSDLLITISEFAGDTWRAAAETMALAPDVDRAALEADDPEPFYVTLPVARVGAKSKNGHTYGAVANQQIVEQVLSKKPEGGLGHLRDDERATRYDLPAIRWLGAMTDAQGTTWVKGYVPKTRLDIRDHFRLAMRSNAHTALSLYGQAEIDGSGEVTRLNLEKIDIADPERAGLPVASTPLITRNMAGDDPAEKEREMTEQSLQEMQGVVNTLQARIAEMAGLLSVQPEQAVETLRQTVQRAKLVSEMSTALGVQEDQLSARVAEMRTEIKLRNAERLSQRIIKELGPALEDLEPLVMLHMGAAEGLLDDDAKLKEAVKAALEQPKVKRLAEMAIKAKGGPALALGTTGQPATFDADKTGYDEARKTGMLRG